MQLRVVNFPISQSQGRFGETKPILIQKSFPAYAGGGESYDEAKAKFGRRPQRAQPAALLGDKKFNGQGVMTFANGQTLHGLTAHGG